MAHTIRILGCTFGIIPHIISVCDYLSNLVVNIAGHVRVLGDGIRT